MKLHAPFMITPRLMAGVQISQSFVSIEFGGETSDGWVIYSYYIDTPEFEHHASDLKSGVGGGSLQAGMESLLSFLSACAESRRYSNGQGDNADLFPDNVGQWAERHSDEIDLLSLEIQEAKTDLIEDDKEVA